MVHKVPDGLPSVEAVFARMMAVSMSTLTTTHSRPPQTVLITGLGPVGHLAAQLFHSCGYHVVASDPVEWRRALAAEVGIRTVAPAEIAGSGIEGKVALAVECSGHEQAVLDACALVRKGGEVVLVGVPWQRKTDRTAHELLSAVFHRYVVLRSGWEWEVPEHETDFRVNSLHGNVAAALGWLSDGRVRVGQLYKTASPAQAQDVYQGLLHNTWDKLAAVFDWTLRE
jgi:threonine dehydrogenase-like Zn-dependent dehydrogenase